MKQNLLDVRFLVYLQLNWVLNKSKRPLVDAGAPLGEIALTRLEKQMALINDWHFRGRFSM